MSHHFTPRVTKSNKGAEAIATSERQHERIGGTSEPVCTATPKLDAQINNPTTKMASPNTTPRWAAFARDTNETKIQLALNLDGGAFPPETDSRLQVAEGADGHATQASKSQIISISTGIGFLDHMLHALSKHAGWSLALNCKGDLHSQCLHNPTPLLAHFVRP